MEHFLAFFFVLAASFAGAAEIRVSWQPVAAQNAENSGAWRVLVLVRPDSEPKDAAPVIAASPEIRVAKIHPEKADLSPRRFSLFYVDIAARRPVCFR